MSDVSIIHNPEYICMSCIQMVPCEEEGGVSAGDFTEARYVSDVTCHAY